MPRPAKRRTNQPSTSRKLSEKPAALKSSRPKGGDLISPRAKTNGQSIFTSASKRKRASITVSHQDQAASAISPVTQRPAQKRRVTSPSDEPGNFDDFPHQTVEHFKSKFLDTTFSDLDPAIKTPSLIIASHNAVMTLSLAVSSDEQWIELIVGIKRNSSTQIASETKVFDQIDRGFRPQPLFAHFCLFTCVQYAEYLNSFKGDTLRLNRILLKAIQVKLFGVSPNMLKFPKLSSEVLFMPTPGSVGSQVFQSADSTMKTMIEPLSTESEGPENIEQYSEAYLKSFFSEALISGIADYINIQIERKTMRQALSTECFDDFSAIDFPLDERAVVARRESPVSSASRTPCDPDRQLEVVHSSSPDVGTPLPLLCLEGLSGTQPATADASSDPSEIHTPSAISPS